MIPVYPFKVNTCNFVMPLFKSFFQCIKVIIWDHENSIFTVRCTSLCLVWILIRCESTVFKRNAWSSFFIRLHPATKNVIGPSAVVSFKSEDPWLSRICSHDTIRHFNTFCARRCEFHFFCTRNVFSQKLCNLYVQW